jgi:hypothetical protein
MEAFFYANHTSQIFDSVSTPGYRLIGELQLDPGSYVVFAKADIATNVASGYPPPPWPHGGGAVSLTLGGSNDTAYAAVKPESGDNIETVALMVAAEIGRSRRARLYILNPYPLRTVVNSVRLTALRVDKLKVSEVGTDVTTLPEEKYLAVAFAMSVGKHIRASRLPDDDD